MEISSLEFIARLLGIPVAFALDPLAVLVVFGYALRWGMIDDPYLLQPAFESFAGDGFLGIVTLLFVLHALADKFPPTAHLLDVVGLVIRPLAAGFVGFWMVDALDTSNSLHVVALAVVFLGSITITAGVHTVRSTVRLAASAKSFGIMMPLISVTENVLGLGMAALLVFRPELAIFLFLAIGIPTFLLGYALLKRIRRTIGNIRSRARRRREGPSRVQP